MSLRLLDAGYDLVVHNRTPARAESAVARGAYLASSAAEVAGSVDAVLVCVTDTAAVQEVALGDQGIARCGEQGLVVVDHSTTDPMETTTISSTLGESGIHWVDAPVSGGPDAARDGSLTMMVGGDPEQIAKVSDVLDVLSARHTRMGDVGAGQLTKLVNQVIVLNGFAVLAEAIRLGEKLGIDVARLPNCLAGGFADSAMLQRIAPRMVKRQYDPPTGTVRIVVKDLDLVHQMSRRTDTPMPMSKLAAEIYRIWVAQGQEFGDPTSIMDLYDPPQI